MSNVTWKKSSHSSSQGDNCVELADLGEVIGVRDSKDPDGPKLVVGRDAFAAWVASLERVGDRGPFANVDAAMAREREHDALGDLVPIGKPP
ncbi:MAG: DUF397 domain-containing protein [Spirillospora sp.]